MVRLLPGSGSHGEIVDVSWQHPRGRRSRMEQAEQGRRYYLTLPDSLGSRLPSNLPVGMCRMGSAGHPEEDADEKPNQAQDSHRICKGQGPYQIVRAVRTGTGWRGRTNLEPLLTLWRTQLGH